MIWWFKKKALFKIFLFKDIFRIKKKIERFFVIYDFRCKIIIFFYNFAYLVFNGMNMLFKALNWINKTLILLTFGNLRAFSKLNVGG